MTNNSAAAYNLLLGTRLLKKHEIKEPIIIGDSEIIKATMTNEKDFNNIAINKIC